jgi:hypothetical protein
MKSYALCPVSNKKVNERVARINGAFTVILLIVVGFTKSIYPVIFLVFDFLLRATNYSKYSIIGISSTGIVRYLALQDNFINARPKYCSPDWSCIRILSALHGPVLFTGVVTGRNIGLFSFLEAAFGICIAKYTLCTVLYKSKFRDYKNTNNPEQQRKM